MTRIHITLATALCDLTQRPARYQTARAVLAALRADGRLSVFDACASLKVARHLERLCARGDIVVTPGAFPWSKVEFRRLER